MPDYLPFINEMPELLLASIIQLGVFAAAVRSGRNREAGCQDKEVENVHDQGFVCTGSHHD